MRPRRLVLIAALCARAGEASSAPTGCCAANHRYSLAPGAVAKALGGSSPRLAVRPVRRALALRGGWGSLPPHRARPRGGEVMSGIFPDDELTPMHSDVRDALDRAVRAVRPWAAGLDDEDEELFDRWNWRAAATGSGTPYWWRPGEDEEDPEVTFEDPSGGAIE